MPNIHKQSNDQPLNTKDMRVVGDGSQILIGGQRFKRTVLKSSATPTKATEEDALLEEIEQDETKTIRERED